MTTLSRVTMCGKSIICDCVAALLATLLLMGNASAVGETADGDRAADALRAAAGTQLALVTDRALADPAAATVATALTPAALYALLERAVAAVTVDPATERIDESQPDDGAFVQISGFSFRYDATAPAGERVLSVAVDGEPLDRTDETRTLSAAASADLCEGTALPLSLADALAQHSPSAQTEADRRITAIGARDNLLAERLPTGLLPAGCLVIAGVAVLYSKKLRRRRVVVTSQAGLYGGISE